MSAQKKATGTSTATKKKASPAKAAAGKATAAKATKSAKPATAKTVKAPAKTAAKAKAAPAKKAAAKATTTKTTKKPVAAKATTAKAAAAKAKVPAAKKAAPKAVKKVSTAAARPAARTAKATAAKPRATTPRARAAARAGKPGREERVLIPEADIVAPVPTDVREHFFHEHRAVSPTDAGRDVPQEYGDTKIVLLVRDPEWVYAYWEINDATRAELHIPRKGHERRMVVRMYKVDGRNWPQESAHYFYDLDVGPYSANWYIRLPEVAATWCAELGMYDDDGNYIPIVRSNLVSTPRDRMSDEVDEEWMTVDAEFEKLYGASGGFTIRERRGSEEILRHLQKIVQPGLTGQAPSSGSMFSGTLVQETETVAVKNFWLRVETELILYGATEPDAKVTVKGVPVKLNEDGTFSLRFSLPDGDQVLAVHATSEDGQFERKITPVVKKNTK